MTPVTRESGKMGKSLKNGVSPDEIYAAYGADTLRLYEMAMGPLDGDRPWHTDDIAGVYRFLQRLWRNLIDERSGELSVDGTQPLDAGAAQRLHQTITAVRHDFSQLRFNTAMARLHELNAYAAQVSARAGSLPRTLAEPLGAHDRATGAAYRRGTVGSAGPRQRHGRRRRVPRGRRVAGGRAAP